MHKNHPKPIRKLISPTITLILLAAALPAIARPRIILGPSDGLALDQPRVAIEVYRTDPIFSFGPEFFNYFVLDTGANGLMAGGNATDEMTDEGYQTVAIYDESGIAGTEEFDVSDLYSLNFAGTSGIPRTLSDVRLLSNPDIELGFDGIIGMDLLTSGWLDALFGGPDGYISQIYLDFRQIENLTATMYLDINPDLDNPVLAGLDQAVSFDNFDYAFLANHWDRTDCSTNQWCGGADFNHDSKIDNFDLAVLQYYWLADSAALPLRYDLFGYSVLASYWLDDNCHVHSFCGGYDFDQNTNLNLADLNIFLTNWLSPPSP